jgi:hypothetical protein
MHHYLRLRSSFAIEWLLIVAIEFQNMVCVLPRSSSLLCVPFEPPFYHNIIHQQNIFEVYPLTNKIRHVPPPSLLQNVCHTRFEGKVWISLVLLLSDFVQYLPVSFQKTFCVICQAHMLISRLASSTLWLRCIASSTLAFSTLSKPASTFGRVAQSSQSINRARNPILSNTKLSVASADAVSVAEMEQGVGGRIEAAFGASKEKGEAVFISFITAGYPTAQGEYSYSCSCSYLYLYL